MREGKRDKGRTTGIIKEITKEKYERREISSGVIRGRLIGVSEEHSASVFRLKE
jgi:hypothetical protein